MTDELPLHWALVHHPVRDRAGATITTAVTNIDVHDLSRSCRTYGARALHVVTPIDAQRRIVEAILSHWHEGEGRRRVPERTDALARCRIAHDLDEVVSSIIEREGRAPYVVATAARRGLGLEEVSFDGVARRLHASEPVLVLVGTGHGLADEALAKASAVLPPIRSGGYNHLSVRAATAILLDRLVGERGAKLP